MVPPMDTIILRTTRADNADLYLAERPDAWLYECDPAKPLEWLARWKRTLPVFVINANVKVPADCVRELVTVYTDKSILLTTTVQQYGRYSELIDGRIHERPLIMESIVGAGLCILTPQVQAFAVEKGVYNLGKLFNAARDASIPFLTHDWNGQWTDTTVV